MEPIACQPCDATLSVILFDTHANMVGDVLDGALPRLR